VSVVVVLGFEIMEKTDTTMEEKRREERPQILRDEIRRCFS
jgi:hypothetical protein